MTIREKFDVPTLVHVGMPKCASTSIQGGIFERCIGWNYIGQDTRSGISLNPRRPKQIWPFITAEATNNTEAISEFSKLIGQKVMEGEPLIISEEGMTFSSAIYPYADRHVIAGRLKSILPSAKILLVIRNQIDFMKSLFGHLKRIDQSRHRTINAWLDELKSENDRGISKTLQIADYSQIYDSYSCLFGESNVDVVLMEDILCSGAHEIILIIEKRLGVPYASMYGQIELPRNNTGVTIAEQCLLTAYRSLPGVKLLMPSSFRRAALTLSRRHCRRIGRDISVSNRQFLNSYYGEGNAKLAKCLGKPLMDYDYPHL